MKWEKILKQTTMHQYLLDKGFEEVKGEDYEKTYAKGDERITLHDLDEWVWGNEVIVWSVGFGSLNVLLEDDPAVLDNAGDWTTTVIRGKPNMIEQMRQDFAIDEITNISDSVGGFRNAPMKMIKLPPLK
mgnify:CR=1 FL=1